MRVGILREAGVGENRVALLPEAVRALSALGVEVLVEAGAGQRAGAPDALYEEAGAAIAERRRVVASSQIVPVVQLPEADDLQCLGPGTVVFGFLRALEEPERLTPAIDAGATLFAVELLPRISRAQAMDALSSMATVAGYKAVILAAEQLPKLFPMLMTAAGTVPPAKVLVVGAGVAGLQAIATARRLGAVVEAFDVRAAAGEQVRSLGARFLEVDLKGMATEDQGGYAKELSEEAIERGRAVIARAAAYSDVVITTAQVPGKRAPLLFRREAVEAMRPGSVIVDLAAPAGGNCELTIAGETQSFRGVTLMAPNNLAATVPVHASQLYGRNVLNFLKLLLRDGALHLDFNDELIAGCCVAHEGAVRHMRVRAALEAHSLPTPVEER